MDNLRRDFLRQSGLLGGAFLLTQHLKALGFSSHALGMKNFLNELTILHTNDLHNSIQASRWGKRSGYGGLMNIESALVSTVPGALIFDAGDFLDQSANYAQHQKMIYHMNGLGYNAATIGNHELANGQEYLSSLMQF